MVHVGCGDREEKVNRIINESYKLIGKEYKCRLDWMGKVTNRKLCKRLKFDHTDNSYVHQQKPVIENEFHNIFWYFKIETYLKIPVRRPDQM